MGDEKKEASTTGDVTNNNVEEKNKEKAKENSEGEDTGKDEKIVIKVDMHCHCEACAKKIVRALRTYQGVEEVVVDRKTNMVVIRGKEDDPMKLCDRIFHKTGRKTQLVFPLPKPPQEQLKDNQNKGEQPKNDEAPRAVTVVLGIYMHCEACAQLLRKHIRKLKGIESVETDVSKDKVIVKGVIGDPEVVAQYVHKRTKKKVTIIKDSEEQKQDSTSEHKKKQDDKQEDKKINNSNDNQGSAKINVIDEAKMMMMMGEVNRSYDYYWPSARYDYMEYHHHNNLNYQPQIFNDENPNACSLM